MGTIAKSDVELVEASRRGEHERSWSGIRTWSVRCPSLSRAFDQLDVTADGSDLIVSLAMSGDQLVQLFARRS